MTRHQLIQSYKSKKQQLLQITLQRQKLSESERKRDTYDTLRLGKLIKKAGLHEEDKRVIFAILCEGHERLLQEGKEARDHYLQRGETYWKECVNANIACKSKGLNEEFS